MKRKCDDTDSERYSKLWKIDNYGSVLRRKLKTGASLNVLIEFSSALQDTYVVDQYIKAGGSVKELTGLLERFDGKNDFSSASIIFAAIYRVVEKVIDDLLLVEESTEKACEELLSTYLSTMFDMLSSSSSSINNRKTVLKLLTVMVRLNGGLAKTILTSFPVNTKMLEILAASSFSGSNDLRIYFINFILSLIDDNVASSLELLVKKGLFSSILPGLINDSPDVVILLMNTFRLKIVENPKISKTLKLHTFNTMSVRLIAKLFDYDCDVDLSHKEIEDISNMNYVQSVRRAVYELLLLLCTSYKKGVLFREQRSSIGKNRNELILTLLEGIDEPYKNEHKSILIAEILRICPEFINVILAKLEPNFQPSATENWIRLINFLILVIKKQEFNSAGSRRDVFCVITSTIFSSSVQKLFSHCNNDAVHESPVIRLHTCRLLVAILEKTSDFINKCVTNTSCNQSTFNTYQDQIEQFLSKSVFPVKKIINAWKVGTAFIGRENVNERVEQLTSNEYYHTLVDLMLLYKTLIPACFNELVTNENFSIYDEAEAIDNSALKFKLARLIFLVHNPKPGEVQFEFMMKQFVEHYIINKDLMLRGIVEIVLRTMGFFEHFENEINVWFYCMRSFRHDVGVIRDLFVETLCVSARKNKTFLKVLINLSCNLVPESEFLIGDDNVSLPADLFNMDQVLDMVAKPTVALSPMVPAFLHVLKNKKYHALEGGNFEIVQTFTRLLFVHLLHLQCDVQPIITLVQGYLEPFVDEKFYDFISFWNNRRPSDEFPEYPLVSDKLAGQCYSELLNEGASDELLQEINNGSEEGAVILWNLFLFYTTRLQRFNLLQHHEKVESITKFFRRILQKLQPGNMISCLKLMLINHYFIDGFKIDHCKKPSSLPSILINIILDLKRDEKIITSIVSRLVLPYRYKFITGLVKIIKNKKYLKMNLLNVSINELVQFVTLPYDLVIFVINEVIQLPVHLYLDENSHSLSQWTEILKLLLEEAAVNLEEPLDDKYLIELISKLINIYQRGVIDETLEISVVKYIKAFPHHICSLPNHVIRELIEHHPKSSISILALYVIPYYPNLIYCLQEKCMSTLKDLNIYSLLEVLNVVNLSEDMELKVLKHLRKMYFRNVNQFFNHEQIPWCNGVFETWLQKLIDHMDGEFVCNLCNDVEENWPCIILNENNCAIIRMIFKKARKLEHFTGILIKKFDKMLLAEENVDWLCIAIKNVVETSENMVFLACSSLWKDFVRLSLKVGLQEDNVQIIRNFRMICEKALCREEIGDVGLIFQMTISHSAFVNKIMNASNIKCELIEFLLLLTKIDASVMSSNHLPVLLASYKGTLSRSDQLLLRLLHRYEESGIRFSECRPYLWGEAAATHHSIQADISVSLKRQPLPNQVLELLDMNIIKNTIKYFPLNRKLKNDGSLYSTDGDLYDLAFILPLMSHLLAPESRISIKKFTRSGALCLILTALSLEDKDMRVAAYHCLYRFSSHLFSREKEIQIWNQFITALKNGINVDVDAKARNHPPRLSCLTTIFLSYMSLIISEPLHPLYRSVLNFVLAKPSFELNCIPNFFILFYSTDLKHREHQEWILKSIRDGMRYEKDWIVAQRSFLFKFLLQYFYSSLSNEKINLLILQIVINSLKIDKCRLVLITKYGLLSWVSQLLYCTTMVHANYLSLIIKLLKLLISTKNSKKILFLALRIMGKLISSYVDKSDLTDLIQILCVTYSLSKKRDILHVEHLKQAIEFSGPLIDRQSKKMFENCLKYKSVVGLEEPNSSDCNLVPTTLLIRIISKFINIDKNVCFQ